MARKLPYFVEHITRKKSDNLEKQLVQGTIPGSRTAGKSKTTWIDIGLNTHCQRHLWILKTEASEHSSVMVWPSLRS